MAYLETQPASLDAPAGAGTALRLGAAAPVLSTLERRIILLSRSDDRASVGAPTRLARLASAIFGFKRLTPLADNRLEALRRYSVLYRLDGTRVAADEHQAIRAAGYAGREIDMIRDLIDSWHLPQRPTLLRRLADAAILLALVAGAVMLHAWVSRQVGDEIVALIVSGAVLATLAPMFARSGGASSHAH